MQSPLSMQEDAHVREACGPSPERTRSITPAMTATGEASAILAGPTLGQASTHLPQVTQASSMLLTRSFGAASKVSSVMEDILRLSRHYSGEILRVYIANRAMGEAGSLLRARTGDITF